MIGLIADAGRLSARRSRRRLPHLASRRRRAARSVRNRGRSLEPLGGPRRDDLGRTDHRASGAGRCRTGAPAADQGVGGSLPARSGSAPRDVDDDAAAWTSGDARHLLGRVLRGRAWSQSSADRRGARCDRSPDRRGTRPDRASRICAHPAPRRSGDRGAADHFGGRRPAPGRLVARPRLDDRSRSRLRRLGRHVRRSAHALRAMPRQAGVLRHIAPKESRAGRPGLALAAVDPGGRAPRFTPQRGAGAFPRDVPRCTAFRARSRRRMRCDAACGRRTGSPVADGHAGGHEARRGGGSCPGVGACGHHLTGSADCPAGGTEKTAPGSLPQSSRGCSAGGLHAPDADRRGRGERDGRPAAYDCSDASRPGRRASWHSWWNTRRPVTRGAMEGRG